MKKILFLLCVALPLQGMNDEDQEKKRNLILSHIFFCFKQVIENKKEDSPFLVPVIERLVFNPFFNKAEIFLSFFRGKEQVAQLKFTCKKKAPPFIVIFVDLICVKKEYQSKGMGSLILNALQHFFYQLSQKYERLILFYLNSAALTNPKRWCNLENFTEDSVSAQTKRAHFYTKNGLSKASKDQSFGEWITSFLASFLCGEEQLFGVIFNGTNKLPVLKHKYNQYQFPIKKLTEESSIFSSLFGQLELFLEPLFAPPKSFPLYPDIRSSYIFNKKRQTSRLQKIQVHLIEKNSKLSLVNIFKHNPKDPWSSKLIFSKNQQDQNIQKKFFSVFAPDNKT